MNREARDDAIIHNLLERIDDSAEINQRTLSRDLGIALGMTNAYLKRCIKKGWVKVKQVPARRYRYYVTPKGFAEKSRLTAQYFSDSLVFFRRARQSFARLYQGLAVNGGRRIVLCGVDELTEIAILCALDQQIEVVAIFDPAGDGGQLYGIRRTATPPADLPWVLAVNQDASAIHAEAVARVGETGLEVPDLLAHVKGPQS